MRRATIGTSPLLIATLSAALAGCVGDAPHPRSADIPPLTETERERVLERGAEAATRLQETLAPYLLSAMEEGGPAAAARLCAVAAETLTDSVASMADLEVKRTTWRFRNPANAPDYWEQEALRHYQRQLEEGQPLPGSFVQAVSAHEARFYRPLVVTALCLHCHGPPDRLAPGVAELLAERYPDDRAVGYEVGDMRGLIRVSVPR